MDLPWKVSYIGSSSSTGLASTYLSISRCQGPTQKTSWMRPEVLPVASERCFEARDGPWIGLWASTLSQKAFKTQPKVTSGCIWEVFWGCCEAGRTSRESSAVPGESLVAHPHRFHYPQISVSAGSIIESIPCRYRGLTVHGINSHQFIRLDFFFVICVLYFVHFVHFLSFFFCLLCCCK